MKVTPVRQYSDPSFPTRSILDERPELLRLVPRRWQANPAVLTALTGVFALSLGAQAIASDTKGQSTSRVAPIFVHGDGMGAFGCKAVNPPVFLSEAEARSVILDEAKKAGIVFEPDLLVLDSISIPVPDRNPPRGYDKNGNPTPTIPPYHPKQKFTFDGTAKRGISFEYVSIEDFHAWEKRPPVSKCTVEMFGLKQTAEHLRLGFVGSTGTVAIFYDPCTGSNDVEKRAKFTIDYNAKDMKAEYAKMREKANQLSREDLRAQVKDFIKWLKAEGVI